MCFIKRLHTVPVKTTDMTIISTDPKVVAFAGFTVSVFKST